MSEVDQCRAFRREEWEVLPVPLRQAQEMVAAHHYAKGGANTGTFVHGLYRRADKLLAGAAWWIPPTRAAATTVNPENWRRVLALSRLVVLPQVPKNGESFLIAGSVAHIRRDGRFLSLVTYADTYRGHTGVIYRATNWEYHGETSATDLWEDPQGRMVARKAGGKTRTHAEMRALGHRLVGYFRKHKYVMHLRTHPRPRHRNETEYLLDEGNPEG